MSLTHITALMTDVMLAAICLGSVAIVVIGIIAIIEPNLLPWIHDDDDD